MKSLFYYQDRDEKRTVGWECFPSHLSRGKSHISNFLWKNQQVFQAEMENLKLVESVLDGLIKSCSQQLFEVTDNLENAAYPF